MKYINDSGYNTITMTQLGNLTRGEIEVEKPIVLISDDGSIGIYENASSIMDTYNITLNIAVVTERPSAGFNNFMNWTQLEEMKNKGHEIISHGFNHTSFTLLNSEERITQFNESKNHIEGNLSFITNAFIFPSNIWNSTIIEECALFYDICTASDGDGNYILNETTLNNGEFNRREVNNITELYEILSRFRIYEQNPLEPNVPKLNLKLNENSGTTAYDSSGTGNNGTISGATWNNDGVLNTLTNLVDYQFTDTVITLLNDAYSWAEIQISYIGKEEQEGYSTMTYLTGQLGEDGLAGWTPAVVALSVGMIFIFYFMRRKGRQI